MKANSIVISALLILSAIVVAMNPTSVTDPHLEGSKVIAPGAIYQDGQGSPDKATVTIEVVGAGDPITASLPQDVVFVIDSSDSMGLHSRGGKLHPGNDPNGLRKSAAQDYIGKLRLDLFERAASVDFDSGAFLLPESNPDGDHLSTDYYQAILNIAPIDSMGATNIPAGMQVANEELINYGWDNHTWIVILLTDGENSDVSMDTQMDDPYDPLVNDAIERDITYYTVGLGVNVNAVLLQNLANMTGGTYHPAADASELQEIYDNIHDEVVSTAGKSVTVDETLTAEFDYVPGSFSTPPSGLSGKAASWDIPFLSIGETWSVSFEVKTDTCGSDMDVDEDTVVTYTSFENNVETLLADHMTNQREQQSYSTVRAATTRILLPAITL
jgi:hypothetical protein